MKIRCQSCMQEYEADRAEGSFCTLCGFQQGTPPKEAYHLHPGILLQNRYYLGTVVAYGGFGIIYRAWDQMMKVVVAIKEYFPAVYVNRNPGEQQILVYSGKKQGEFQAGLKSFLAEARNTAKFSQYENIVKVFDYFEANGTGYMVMEYMMGRTLKQYLKQQGGRLPWDMTVQIGASVMDILKVVHEAGILHRDISPDNIMLCDDGRVKLFDFGAARFSDLESEKMRTIILKIGYAPPEQYRSKSIQGPWTDIYALGATMYRCITGKVPPESVNRQEAVFRKEGDPLKRPSEFAPEIPAFLDTALMRSMALEPELRFRTAPEFKDAVLNKKRIADVEQLLKKKRRNRAVGIAAAALAVTAALSGVFIHYRKMYQIAHLAPTTIRVLISEDIPGEKDIYREMSEEFMQNYPDVSVEISAVSPDEYEEELKINLGKGDGAVSLFESGTAGELPEMEEMDPKALFGDSPAEEFLISGENKVHKVPLGFEVPVLYENTGDAAGEAGGENQPDAFLRGEAKRAVFSSTRYHEVQEALPGVYAVSEAGTGDKAEKLHARGLEFFSVNRNASELDRAAAERLLSYWMGEKAQDILHVRYHRALPVRKTQLTELLNLTPELKFLDGFTPEQLCDEDQESFDQFCEKYYGEP